MLTGCAAPAKILVRELPPIELLRECPVPILSIKTNADLVNGVVAYHESLGLCNIDKAALREWAKEAE